MIIVNTFLGYQNLGDFSQTPPGRKIFLWCDKCCVTWTGCQDAAECPKCRNTDAWEELTRDEYV